MQPACSPYAPRLCGRLCALHTRAARSFAAGEVVFAESAVLCATPEWCAALRLGVAVLKKRAAGSYLTRHRPVSFPPALPASGCGAGVVVAAGISEDARLLERVLRSLHPTLPATGEGSGSSDGGGSDAPVTTERLADVIAANCAEVAFGPAPLGAVFLVFSLVNHNCSPNVAWASSWSSVFRAPQAVVFAQRAIFEGEEQVLSPSNHRFCSFTANPVTTSLTSTPRRLHFSYVATAQGREARLAELRAGWGFECACERCAVDGDALLACALCGGPVPCGGAGCAACGEPWPRCGAMGRAAALRARDNALFDLDAGAEALARLTDADAAAEAGARAARAAMRLLHPWDAGLRSAISSIVSNAVGNACRDGDGFGVGGGGSVGGSVGVTVGFGRACLCTRSRLLLDMAASARAGCEASPHLPLPQRAVAGALLEAEAASLLLACTAACGRAGCAGAPVEAATAVAAAAFDAVARAADVPGVVPDKQAAAKVPCFTRPPSWPRRSRRRHRHHRRRRRRCRDGSGSCWPRRQPALLHGSCPQCA